FEKHEKVLAAVAYRSVLPLSVTEKLVTLVGDHVRDHLISHHALAPETALAIALGATERATVDLVDQAGRTIDVRGFVVHLAGSKRLTSSLLLRALAQGHMTFFEWGVAELAGVPHHRTWLMIHDAGPLGLRAIYERAGLPARLFPAFRAAVDTFHSMEFDGGARDRERFQERMLQRFLTHPDQAGHTADVKGFVVHLHATERLTPSLLLRALAQGHMTFFEWGVAELAGVPHHRTWLMIHDAGPLGLRAIYERAGLPVRLFPAFRAAVDTFHSMEFDGGARDLERFQQHMLQRFLTQPDTAARDDVDYLLEKMDELSGERRTELGVVQSA
ncbi:MAG TPA: DUF2336 domain-containing protein, partial [Phenylobacterium sp.]